MLDKLFNVVFGKKNIEDEEKVLKELSEAIDNAAQELVDKYLNSLIPAITFEKLSDGAIIPTRADNYAEGMDLYSPVSVTVPANGQANIKLGIKADIPNGYWLMFKSRSGLAWRNGIEVGAGVIDNNYKAELGLVIHNHSDMPYLIVAGDRIGQAIPMRSNALKIVEGTVEDGERGGFGSSGK